MAGETKIEWRSVPGYDGYSVTADGHMRGPLGEMRPMVAHRGHLYVLVRRPDVPRKLYVHRAVLLAFVGPCPAGRQCRHLNGVPADNRVENLRWGTAMENADDKRRHGIVLKGEQVPAAKLTEDDVREIRRLRPTMTLRALAALFGVSHTEVRRASLGTKWSHVAR